MGRASRIRNLEKFVKILKRRTNVCIMVGSSDINLGGGQMRVRKQIKSSLTKELLEELYFNQSMSLDDIGRIYGCSRQYVKKLAGEYRLELRNRSEARLRAYKAGKFKIPYYEVNENFFSEWTSEMAYVLGFISADGCISSKRANRSPVLSITIKDEELLFRIRKSFSSTHPIRKTRRGLFLLHIARVKLIADLRKLGITCAKSRVLEFPLVPKEFLHHFIRGYFDGDGSVMLSGGQPRVSFTCGSKRFIQTLEEKLSSETHCARRQLYLGRDRNGEITSFAIKYTGKAVLDFFIYMYQGYPDIIFLERKFNKFIELIEHKYVLAENKSQPKKLVGSL